MDPRDRTQRVPRRHRGGGPVSLERNPLGFALRQPRRQHRRHTFLWAQDTDQRLHFDLDDPGHRTGSTPDDLLDAHPPHRLRVSGRTRPHR
ncbi:DUF6461 domain-containing protein [Streptomyces sp. NPDC056663]|uniref:DUF6461 domain-containing protein n=1 Tax=Streptomyces sp. NPDC056663 TaxID=3345899 RepID=UPI00367AEE5D